MSRAVFTLEFVYVYFVDTEEGDGAVNFTELDSDYSEPGKHVWTFDMTSVLHVCLHDVLHDMFMEIFEERCYSYMMGCK